MTYFHENPDFASITKSTFVLFMSLACATTQAAPRVEWPRLMDGSKVSGPVDESICRVSVEGSEHIERVEFFVDGVALNTELQAPYTCKKFELDTGHHELTAIAYDSSDAFTKATVNVESTNELKGANRPAGSRDYYVSASGRDGNSGTIDSPWKTISKINSMKLNPGDIVHLSGTITDDLIGNQKGSSAAPITFQGDGQAVIKGIRLSDAWHLKFVNLEAKGELAPDGTALVTIQGLKGSVHHVVFDHLYLHNSDRGITIGNHCKAKCPVIGSDIMIRDTVIDSMNADGVLYDDFASDRISIVGGSIKHTGKIKAHGLHGVYASGGHGHLFDGIAFAENHHGWSISMRRGNTTVRNCRFTGFRRSGNDDKDAQALGNVNEDPNNSGLTYWIHDNVFEGPGAAMYQGGVNDPQFGAGKAPRNTWKVFNNSFNNLSVNFSGSGDSIAGNTDIYLCNNSGTGGLVLGKPNQGYTHEENCSMIND